MAVLVGISEICNLLAGDGKPPLTPMRITQLVREGMPKTDRGQYDPARCMYWYIGKLRGHVGHKEGEDGSSTQGERKGLLKVQRAREELALAKDLGQVMEVRQHELILADMVLDTKARVMAVAPRAAPDLVGETSRVMIQAKLEKHLKEALHQLAQSVPRLAPPDSPAPAAKPTKSKPTKKKG